MVVSVGESRLSDDPGTLTDISLVSEEPQPGDNRFGPPSVHPAHSRRLPLIYLLPNYPFATTLLPSVWWLFTFTTWDWTRRTFALGPTTDISGSVPLFLPQSL